MATLADARKAALAPGGGGFVANPPRPYDARHTLIGGASERADNWYACSADGSPTSPAQAAPSLADLHGIAPGLTGDQTTREFLDENRGWTTTADRDLHAQVAPPAETALPDTGALWEQAVEAEKADYFNHTKENAWDVLESVKDRVAVLKAERDKSTETE
jgi:hypothetical protein